MVRIAMFVQTAFAIVLLHGSSVAFALCGPPFAETLDEGLQRALVLQARDLLDRLESTDPDPVPEETGLSGPLRIDGRPLEEDEIRQRLGLAAVDIGGLIDGGLTEEDDCSQALHQLLLHDAYARAPSVASPELEAAWTVPHLRWYLVTVPPADFVDFAREFRDGGTLYGGAIHALQDIHTFLVHVPTVAQFAYLFFGPLQGQDYYVMEDFPLVPAIGDAKLAIGAVRGDLPVSGVDRFAVAIIDTGVRDVYFGDRIVEQACFSSTMPLLVNEVGANALCPPGGTDLMDVLMDGESREYDGNHNINPEAESHYVLEYFQAVEGGVVGRACKMFNDCDHGTQVAYIAAGQDLDPLVDSGLAPSLKVISVQVASWADGNYCVNAAVPFQSCAVIFPHDVLRALKYLGVRNQSWRNDPDDAPGGATLVAVNMSLQVNKACRQPREPGPDDVVCLAEGSEATTWERAEYSESCAGSPFAEYVEGLHQHAVWTVIAAGNRKDGADLGKVSSPACVPTAITVAAFDDRTGPTFIVSRSSMFSDLVDLVAPGVEVSTPAATDTDSGTSFAAPLAAASLAILRARAAACGGSEDTYDPAWELAWLKANARPIRIHHDDRADPPFEEVTFDLGLNLGFESFHCP